MPTDVDLPGQIVDVKTEEFDNQRLLTSTNRVLGVVAFLLVQSIPASMYTWIVVLDI